MKYDYTAQFLKKNGDGFVMDISLADSFYTKLMGLMFYKKFPSRNSNAGVLLKNCKSVHGFFMFFDIGVVFLLPVDIEMDGSVESVYEVLQVSKLKSWSVVNLKKPFDFFGMLGLNKRFRKVATLEVPVDLMCEFAVGDFLKVSKK